MNIKIRKAIQILNEVDTLIDVLQGKPMKAISETITILKSIRDDIDQQKKVLECIAKWDEDFPETYTEKQEQNYMRTIAKQALKASF